MGQRPPSASLQVSQNLEEFLLGLPDGCAALQRCLDRAGKMGRMFCNEVQQVLRLVRNNQKPHFRLEAGLLVHPMLTMSQRSAPMARKAISLVGCIRPRIS